MDRPTPAIVRAVRYASGEWRKDLDVRRALGADRELVFYCGAAIDLEWVRSTLAAARRAGRRCAVVISGDPLRSVPAEVDSEVPLVCGSAYALRWVRAPIVVTASSGVSRRHVPPDVRLVHMPHTLSSLHMIYPEGAFDAYHELFAVGEHHMEEAARLTTLRSSFRARTHLVGYGKTDLLAAQSALPPLGVEAEVLLAPSFGGGKVLDAVGMSLVTGLLRRGYRVTVRPHPLHWDGSFCSRFRAEFATHPLARLDDPNSGMDVLRRADVLISDFSGVSYEFAFSRLKPVVYLDTPLKVNNENWRALGLTPFEVGARTRVGRLVSPEAEQVADAVSELLGKGTTFAESIRQVRDHHCANFGRVGEVAYATLADWLPSAT